MNKRGQIDLVTGLVFGIASLVIAIIIAFVIVGTLIDANLFDDETITNTVANESQHTEGIMVFLNETTYTLAGYNSTWSSITVTDMWNSSQSGGDGGYNISISTAPAIITVTNGVIENASTVTFDNISISYTYVHTFAGRYEQSSDALSANFTDGVNNISTKIPTVLLVAAIVLILGVLAILLLVWQKMKMGNSSL